MRRCGRGVTPQARTGAPCSVLNGDLLAALNTSPDELNVTPALHPTAHPTMASLAPLQADFVVQPIYAMTRAGSGQLSTGRDLEYLVESERGTPVSQSLVCAVSESRMEPLGGFVMIGTVDDPHLSS